MTRKEQRDLKFRPFSENRKNYQSDDHLILPPMFIQAVVDDAWFECVNDTTSFTNAYAFPPLVH